MIQISNLVKIHGPHRILDGVSLNVTKGQVAAFIGPSGSGKSTLLRCVNGLESFQEGTVQVEEVQRSGATKENSANLLAIRRKLGMVFQSFNLFPHMNALQNVASGPRYVLKQDRDASEAKAMALLEKVGLKERALHRPDQLSGGQQQRVAIARALAVDPSAMLFDEPTSALDPRMADEVQGVISDLAKGGMTMLVVTHAMGFARRVADQVFFMSAGKIAEEGPPGRFFDSPATPEAREFLRKATND